MFQIVAVVAGSLRQGSYNRALLRAAQQLAPVSLQIRIHELSEIPLFNEDVEHAGIPPGVAHLRQAVAEADGFLVVTPEYNHGIPGVLKNAFDWLSRPSRNSVLSGKPAADPRSVPPVLLKPEVLVAPSPARRRRSPCSPAAASGASRTFCATCPA